jgi:hypothetical protein
MNERILPNEIILLIISFCDEKILITLRHSHHFSLFHKDIQKAIDKLTRAYWKKIQVEYIGFMMQPQMEKHVTRMLFGEFGASLERKMFLQEWHESDIDIYGSLLNLNVDTFFSKIHNEKKRFEEKYGEVETFNELAPRNAIFNRFLPIFSIDQIRGLIVG